MAHRDEKVLVIEQFLSTRRRIREVEREALAKVGAKAPSGNLCSFCGITEKDARFLIHGNGEARICAKCITEIQGTLNDGNSE